MIRSILVAALSVGLASAYAAQPAPAAKPAKPARTAKAKPAQEDPTLPPAGGEQTAAAAMVHYGHYDCEFSQTVNVTMNPKYEGYVDVTLGKSVYTMKPVLSSTGALRLEDVKGKTLMLQIAYKSMLMDTQAGRRLVDECVNEKQMLAKKAAEGVPQQALLVDPNAAPQPKQQ